MTRKKKRPDPIDVYVGSRIRLRRNIVGLSQEKLGKSLGITFQQVQKYEKGTNRVGASRLQSIAAILDVPVSYFFEGTTAGSSARVSGEGETSGGGSTGAAGDFAEGWSDYSDFSSSTEGLQLLRAFSNIHDSKIRRKIIDLAKALADDDLAGQANAGGNDSGKGADARHDIKEKELL